MVTNELLLEMAKILYPLESFDNNTLITTEEKRYWIGSPRFWILKSEAVIYEKNLSYTEEERNKLQQYKMKTKVPFGFRLTKCNDGIMMRKHIDIYPDKCQSANDNGIMPPLGWNWIGDGLCNFRSLGTMARWAGFEEATRYIDLIKLMVATPNCDGADLCRVELLLYELERQNG